jgi:hypothetical protein
VSSVTLKRAVCGTRERCHDAPQQVQMACRSSAECRFARENAMQEKCFAWIPSALCAAAPAEARGWSESHQVWAGATRVAGANRSSAGAIRPTQRRPDFPWGGTNFPEADTGLIGRRRGDYFGR